jgi:hypothetical protein
MYSSRQRGDGCIRLGVFRLRGANYELGGFFVQGCHRRGGDATQGPECVEEADPHPHFMEQQGFFGGVLLLGGLIQAVQLFLEFDREIVFGSFVDGSVQCVGWLGSVVRVIAFWPTLINHVYVF